MASRSDSSLNSFVEKLVCHILKKPPDAIKRDIIKASDVLSCCLNNYDVDESSITEKIQKKFLVDNKDKEALKFVKIHHSLRSSSVLKNRVSVLNFLNCMYGSDKEELTRKKQTNDISLPRLPIDLGLNSRDLIKNINKPHLLSPDLGDFFKNLNTNNYMPDPVFLPCANKGQMDLPSTRVTALLSNGEKQGSLHLNGKSDFSIERALSARSEDSNLGSIACSLSNMKPLLRDVLYAMQGLRGEIIHWEPDINNFDVTFKEDLPNPVKQITLRFMELGWMYCKIDKYCKSSSKAKSSGLIAQSFVAALKSKLVEYYKLIAELEALLTQETTLNQMYTNSSCLTLHRLSVWIFEPHTQLKILASIVETCKLKKGGALASVLYAHLQHGDPFVRSLIQNLLRDVTRPLFKMLSDWIYCGELEDVFGEFFVATNISVLDINLWQDKYCLNKSMIPSFITMDQARKILSTGKAINYLHQVCHDNTFVRDEKRKIKALDLLSTESLFSQEKDTNFESILEKNYVKTSKTVLQVLHDKYDLMDHLYAMRNYFLLGQGDFIRHLMDLLDTDLAKPGKNLYIHNLTGILESAIRATNAQYHNPEVLQRLDVRLLEVDIGDVGWDVFCLDYHVDGPIGTVFTANSMNSYYRLFNTLWRAKRMEYILSKISHSRSTYLKWQARIPDITPVLYQCHIILSQMVHFVQQMQYYMAFEVMECCWADLLLKISQAQDLDQVIAAHENFLNMLISRALLDEDSFVLSTQLKSIYTQIILFDKIQEEFWDKVRNAIKNLDEMDELSEVQTAKGEWGITEQQKNKYKEPLKILLSFIKKTQMELKILSNRYEDYVQKFLIMLTDQDDPNLRFLSFRLDFNEHFKRKNRRLQSSLTYQHRRKSLK